MFDTILVFFFLALPPFRNCDVVAIQPSRSLLDVRSGKTPLLRVRIAGRKRRLPHRIGHEIDGGIGKIGFLRIRIGKHRRPVRDAPNARLLLALRTRHQQTHPPVAEPALHAALERRRIDRLRLRCVFDALNVCLAMFRVLILGVFAPRRYFDRSLGLPQIVVGLIHILRNLIRPQARTPRAIIAEILRRYGQDAIHVLFRLVVIRLPVTLDVGKILATILEELLVAVRVALRVHRGLRHREKSPSVLAV